MLVRLLPVVAFCFSLFASPVQAKSFCDTAFAEVQIDLHDGSQVRRIDWIQGRDVAHVRNNGILDESLAVLMRRPNDYVAVSFDTFFDHAVAVFHEDNESKSPVATLFVLTDNRNKSSFGKVVVDLLNLHNEFLSPHVKQVNLYLPIERPDLARNVTDAAKELGLASTSIETNPQQIERSLLPVQARPVDEFYDLVELYSPPGHFTTGDFYLVTVYFE